MKRKSVIAIIAMVMLVMPQMVLADADIHVVSPPGPTTATANVDLCVVVPEILIFGVGSVAGTIDKIQWDLGIPGFPATQVAGTPYPGPFATGTTTPAFTAPAPYGTTPAASFPNGPIPGGSVAANVATLPVYLFSNDHQGVIITATVLSGAAGAGAQPNVLEHSVITTDTIPIANILQANVGAVIPHPAGSSATTPIGVGGVINLNDNWTYTYTPTTLPLAGQYDARVTYVAATP